MKLHLWGTDFRRSSAELRKQLAFSPEKRNEQIRGLLSLGFQDLVYIATCNRVEFYTTVPDYFSDSRPLWMSLLNSLGLGEDAFFKGYHLEGKSAVRHLLRVASSLESLVVGESQILGQLKESLFLTKEAGLPVKSALERSFHLAFETAKKVRSETPLGEKSVSVVSLGLDHLKEMQTRVPLTKAVVVGRGSTSISIIHWLRKHHPEVPILWVNRNLEVLDQFAEGVVLQKQSLRDFLDSPSDFSHLFTATASLEPIFNQEFFDKLPLNPRAVFDFAQPADVGTVNGEGLEVFRLEHIQQEAKRNRELRTESVKQAEKIIEEALKSHLLQQKETPVLRDFNQIEAVFEEELLRAYCFIEKDFPLEYQSSLKKLAEGIVKKNLHLSREHLRNILRRVADIGPDSMVV
jgi:glutamyl-tRNA reductase